MQWVPIFPYRGTRTPSVPGNKNIFFRGRGPHRTKNFSGRLRAACTGADSVLKWGRSETKHCGNG
ncbi:hypothetical protein DW651_17340 [Subdoligranulum sp. AM23-21AC]|nr:hypothetical protein DW651_17340 [Subdoligranulum sp. AM23-21AC]